MFKHDLYFPFEFICLPLPLQLTYHSVFQNRGKKFTWYKMQHGLLSVEPEKSNTLHCYYSDKRQNMQEAVCLNKGQAMDFTSMQKASTSLIY